MPLASTTAAVRFGMLAKARLMVLLDVAMAVLRKRLLYSSTFSLPAFGADCIMRFSISAQRKKSIGFRSGEYLGKDTILYFNSFLTALALEDFEDLLH